MLACQLDGGLSAEVGRYLMPQEIKRMAYQRVSRKANACAPVGRGLGCRVWE